MVSKRKKTKLKKIKFPLILGFLVIAFLASLFSNNSLFSALAIFEGDIDARHVAEKIPPQNFYEAKRAAREIWSDHRQTFYCGCSFNQHHKIDLNSCGYQIQADLERANRVEWEHIVPISQIAGHLPCWKKKLCCKENGECYRGRNCCQKIDPDFARMEADLHNLVPEIGELNALRSNYRFGLLPFINPGQFGSCEMKIDAAGRRVEPPIETRGLIARAYLYIAERYEMRLSDSQRQLFDAWDKLYPPDEWEHEWNRRVTSVQGNTNEHISKYQVKSEYQ